MENLDEVAERLTRILSTLISNQNFNAATNSKYADCPISLQVMDQMCADCLRGAKPTVHNGVVIVNKTSAAKADLSVAVKRVFEDEVERVMDDNDLPMWLCDLARFAVASVDYVALADDWVSDAPAVLERVGFALEGFPELYMEVVK